MNPANTDKQALINTFINNCARLVWISGLIETVNFSIYIPIFVYQGEISYLTYENDYIKIWKDPYSHALIVFDKQIHSYIFATGKNNEVFLLNDTAVSMVDYRLRSS